ncbi:MAG TPA: hypothetical protein VFY87_06995, partial [Geminicoccaceae bacterium]|nr:hypothetical protein [Geminicoccaceae bacterium]
GAEHARIAGSGTVAGAARRRPPGPWALRWGKLALGALLLALLGWHVDRPATLIAITASVPVERSTGVAVLPLLSASCLLARPPAPAGQALADALLYRLVMVAVSLPGGLLRRRGGRRPEPGGPARGGASG